MFVRNVDQETRPDSVINYLREGNVKVYNHHHHRSNYSQFLYDITAGVCI